MRDLIQITHNMWKVDLTKVYVYKINELYHVCIGDMPVYNNKCFKEIQKFVDSMEFLK